MCTFTKILQSLRERPFLQIKLIISWCSLFSLLLPAVMHAERQSGERCNNTDNPLRVFPYSIHKPQFKVLISLQGYCSPTLDAVIGGKARVAVSRVKRLVISYVG